MSLIEGEPRFGTQLQDSFKVTNAWVSLGISWLEEVQQFYRDRAVIEREYSSKLMTLARKYIDRKTRKTTILSVGETPAITPGSLERQGIRIDYRSHCMTTWNAQLTTLEQRAAEHEKFAASLVSQLAEPLKLQQSRFEELRRAHADYAARLEKEKDWQINETRKCKSKYDSECQELESRRKKLEAPGDTMKSKAHIAYQQQKVEMDNAKNTYLISINAANQYQRRYYDHYVPQILDGLQDISETKSSRLNKIWLLAARREKDLLVQGIKSLDHLSADIPRNDPKLESLMFVRHNIYPRQNRPEFVFEPSPIWHDEPKLVDNESTRNFLCNTLIRSKRQLVELRRQAEKKKSELQIAMDNREKAHQEGSQLEEFDLIRAVFNLKDSLHDTDRLMTTAETEISTITNVVGDLSLGARNHSFRSEVIKIPVNCDFCGEKIWGLSARGMHCKDCGFTCHNKCQMKCPADCPGQQSKEEKKRLKLHRQEAVHAAEAQKSDGITPSSSSVLGVPIKRDTFTALSSLGSGLSMRLVSRSDHKEVTASKSNVERRTSIVPSTGTLIRKRSVAPLPASQDPVDQSTENFSLSPDSTVSSGKVIALGKVLYSYQSGAEGELTVCENDTVEIIEADDGSGWTYVRKPRSASQSQLNSGSIDVREAGLVPTSYIEIQPGTEEEGESLDAKPFSSSRVDSPRASISAESPSFCPPSLTRRKTGPAVAPKRGGRKLQYVRALYPYEARSDGEMSMAEGERFVLIVPDSGNGWAEVERSGHIGAVPASYVEYDN